MTPEEAKSVLTILDYQVHNGGFLQYYDNILSQEPPGYLDRLIVLAQKGATLDLPSYAQLENILRNIRDIGTPEDLGGDEIISIPCEECGGSGEILDYFSPDDEDDKSSEAEEVSEECYVCDGEGTYEDIEFHDGWEEYGYSTDSYTLEYVSIAKEILEGIDVVAAHAEQEVELNPSKLVTFKPRCKLLGTDSNIFSLTGKASQALRKDGQKDRAEELKTRLFDCSSYHEALNLISEYVEIE